MAVPANMWECPTCGDYVDKTRLTCPRCNNKTNSMFPNKSSLTFLTSESNNSQVESWTLKPSHSPNKSWAATFLKVIAVILFVGGLVVACTTANIEVTGGYYSSYSYNEFSWAIFFETYLLYGLGGCFTLCASELFENIKRIADALTDMEIRKKTSR